MHSYAFFSRKFIVTKFNYEIYDKKILIIVDYLTIWCHYFEKSSHQLKIYTNHKNLIWFMKIKAYNHHQIHWTKKLISFNFVIIYRSSVLEGKFDALSRWFNYRFLTRENVSAKFNEFKFLKLHQFINFSENTEYIIIITHFSLSIIMI